MTGEPTRFQAFLGALVLLVVGGAGGFLAGRVYTHAEVDREFERVFTLPKNEFWATEHPRAVWQRFDWRGLMYRPLPTKDTVEIVNMFGSPPPPEAPPTSTTLPASKEAKR